MVPKGRNLAFNKISIETGEEEPRLDTFVKKWQHSHEAALTRGKKDGARRGFGPEGSTLEGG